MDLFALPSRPPPISSPTPLCFPPTRRSFERSSLHRARMLLVSVKGESPGNSSRPPLAPSSPPFRGEDLPAVDVVSKLSSVKGKSIAELSEIFRDECRCVCSFLPFFRTFHGKEQVISFFSFLTKTFGNQIEFTVRPTLPDGISIGVTWKLEWNKKHMPFGRGFSLHLCQIYQGRITIRNAETVLELFLRFEPFKANVEAVLMTVMEKIRSLVPNKEEAKKTAGYLVLTLLVASAILMLLLK